MYLVSLCCKLNKRFFHNDIRVNPNELTGCHDHCSRSTCCFQEMSSHTSDSQIPANFRNYEQTRNDDEVIDREIPSDHWNPTSL